MRDVTLNFLEIIIKCFFCLKMHSLSVWTLDSPQDVCCLINRITIITCKTTCKLGIFI